MKLQSDNDEDYRGLSVKMPTIILVASAAIFLILAIVVAANGGNKKHHSNNSTVNTLQAGTQDDGTDTETEDKLTASDLDFWNMYQGEESNAAEPEIAETTSRKDELEQHEAEMNQSDVIVEPTKEEEKDPSTDGKHTKVVHTDGTTEWIAINSSLKLNGYDDTLFQSRNGIISYVQGTQSTTRVGADISQYTTSVDWDRLSTEVDYVMIRIGARGYDTGKIIADTKFTEYVKAAVAHGIPFGVYFSSQAISVDEAKEEAKYITDQLQIIRDEINKQNTQTDNSNTTLTPGTTVSTDGLGNIITTTVDAQGNSTIVVTDANNKVVSTTTINSDAYGNTSTIVKDGDGNIKSTKLEQKDLTSGVITVTTSTYNADGTVTTVTETTTPVNTGNNAANTTEKHEFALNYPVAVDMHFIANDTARIERISKTERTNILATFCAEIEKSGYNSMIYANKEFLLCQLDLSSLTKYDIWLLNEGDLPDYPYMLSMWKYSNGKNKLESLSGDYGLDVGFIDYSMR